MIAAVGTGFPANFQHAKSTNSASGSTLIVSVVDPWHSSVAAFGGNSRIRQLLLRCNFCGLPRVSWLALGLILLESEQNKSSSFGLATPYLLAPPEREAVCHGSPSSQLLALILLRNQNVWGGGNSLQDRTEAVATNTNNSEGLALHGRGSVLFVIRNKVYGQNKTLQTQNSIRRRLGAA